MPLLQSMTSAEAQPPPRIGHPPTPATQCCLCAMQGGLALRAGFLAASVSCAGGVSVAPGWRRGLRACHRDQVPGDLMTLPWSPEPRFGNALPAIWQSHGLAAAGNEAGITSAHEGIPPL